MHVWWIKFVFIFNFTSQLDNLNFLCSGAWLAAGSATWVEKVEKIAKMLILLGLQKGRLGVFPFRGVLKSSSKLLQMHGFKTKSMSMNNFNF